MSRNDGGPAFPLPEGQVLHNPEHGFVEAEDHARYHESGMSLRDYFAAKAMQGFSASPSMIDSNDSRAIAYVAAASYAMADAMLATRSA
jgi:hypothetical protein